MDVAPIRFFSDHDIAGYAQLLWGTLASVGWLDFIRLELITFLDSINPYDVPPLTSPGRRGFCGKFSAATLRWLHTSHEEEMNLLVDI